MRVGVLLDRHDPAKGGMERAVAQLVAHLAAQGHEAFVYGVAAADRAPGTFRRVAVPRLPRGRFERALAERSLGAAATDACDVTLGVRHAPGVDVHWPHGGSHAATLAAGEAARGRVGGAASRALHALSPRHRAFLALEAETFAAGGCREVWCVSQLVRDELAAAYPHAAGRLVVHGNGVDLARFHPGVRGEHRDATRRALGVPDGVPLLLFLGTNRRLKGWHVLLRALLRLRDLTWRCATTGDDAAAIACDADAAGIGGRVAVTDGRDVRPLYAAADLVVQPTYRDPCSLVTLEALACGVPVLTSSANGAADALRDAAAGEVVATGDAEAFAAALAAWSVRLADPECAERSRAAAAASGAARDARAWLDGLVAALVRAAAR